MNSASLKSNRLKRTLAVLADCEEHITRDIILKAHVLAVNSVVSELRANGVAVSCRRERGVYYYRLGLVPTKSAKPANALKWRLGKACAGRKQSPNVKAVGD